MDELELPMLFCLLEEMREIPPQDFLAAAQMKKAQQDFEREQKGALSSFNPEKGRVMRREDYGD